MCLLATPVWAGEVFKYTEADGTIVYTNVPPQGLMARRASRMRVNRAPPKLESAPSEPRALSVGRIQEYEQHIEKSARQYRIPAPLVRAVMHAESAFDPRALSEKGACGLMQLMPRTAGDMGVRDVFDPEQNVAGGVRYLRVLANEFDGDMVKMVAAYNAGPEAVRRANGGVPPIEETQVYVRRVLALYWQYKRQSQAQATDPVN